MSPRSAARREQWSALGLAVLALGYLLAGRAYPLDTLATPGPGIVPLAAGVALLALAIWQFLAVPRSAPDPGHRGAVPRAPLIMSAVLALYAATLPVGWWRPAALALGVTVVSRLLFGAWLGVPLP